MSQHVKIISSEDCKSILSRALNSPFHFVDYNIKKFSDDILGFLGEHFLLTVTFTRNKETIDSHLQKTFFVKTLPIEDLQQVSYLEESGIFKKEVLLYKNLLPELLKISSFGPKCFLIKDSCLVLEDLQASGFRSLPTIKYLNGNNVTNMIINLANYHATTIIYEEENNIRLDKHFLNEIRETCFNFTKGQPRYNWCVTSTKCVCDLLELSGLCTDPKVLSRFEDFVFGEMPLLIQPSKKFRNVLSHDDLWVNNMLFKEDKCVFVDFQLARYTPPAFDFLTTLFLNLQEEDITENFSNLSDFYFKVFMQKLETHNLNENVFRKKDFENSLVTYRLAALTEAALFATIIYISNNLSAQIFENLESYNEFIFLNRSKFCCEEFKNNGNFRERVTNILRPLIKTLLLI